MDKTVKLSVIVATYHRDLDVKRALESLASQSFSDFEVVLVDDNADDSWCSKVEMIVDEMKDMLNIQYIKNPTNQGSAATRNIGIQAAKGEYITFLDDDDVYLPQKLELQLEDMEGNQADYGLTDLYLYNEKNVLIDKRIRSYILSYDKEELMRYHLLHHMTGTDTMMFRTEYLRKIGGFPGIDIGDEFYLMKEAILNGGKFCYSNHCQVKAYVHSGENNGLSSGQKKIDGENALYSEKMKYYKYLSSKEIQYVKMRHYAVIAFAELRRRKLGAFLSNATRSLIASPVECIKLLLGKT